MSLFWDDEDFFGDDYAASDNADIVYSTTVDDGINYTPLLSEFVPAESSQPFDHLGRLQDKLWGAAELVLDNVLFEQRLSAEQNNAAIRQVQSPVLVPAQVTSFIQRYFIFLIGVLLVWLLLLRR